MRQQKSTRLYWKDALQQVHIKSDNEKTTARKNKWVSAFHQAQAELKDPSAVVWLPDEIADVIRQAHPTPEISPAQTRRQRLKTLLLALFFLVPAAISYLLAYRRISALR